MKTLNQRRRIFLFLMMTVLGLGKFSVPSAYVYASPSRTFTGGCLPAERIPTSIQAELVRLMGKTDALSNQVLKSWGIARVATSQIAIVSDTTTCRRASNAYSAALAISPDDRLVYTVRAGIRYLVLDPKEMAGEWKIGVTFDSSFTQVVSKFGY